MFCQMDKKHLVRYFAGYLPFDHCVCTRRFPGDRVCSFSPNSFSNPCCDCGQIVFKVTLFSWLSWLGLLFFSPTLILDPNSYVKIHEKDQPTLPCSIGMYIANLWQKELQCHRAQLLKKAISLPLGFPRLSCSEVAVLSLCTYQWLI